MLSDRQLLTLAEEIYDVALDPTRWSAVLRTICEATRSSMSSVVTQKNDSGICPWGIMHGIDDTDRNNYASYYGTMSPTFFQFQGLGAGSVITDEMHINRRSYTETEIYNDFFKPLKIERSTTIMLERSRNDSTYLCVRREECSNYSNKDIEDIRRISGHVHRAIKLQRRTHFEDQLEIAINAALDHVKSGLVLLAPDGSTLKFNREAERIIAAHDGVYVRGSRLYIERNGCLVDASTLVHGDGSANPQSFDPEAVAVQRPLRRPYIVFAYPLGKSNGDEAGRSGTAVFITDTERNHGLTVETIRDLFGLTPAEARLAAALAEGKALQEYSDEANIASSTARSTLKSIFKKTQTSRQAELVKLVLSCNVSAR